MLIGKLNYEKISKDYTGLETETAKTIVDNEKQTIKVDVKTIDELTSLKDVSISNLQNDQILQYNKDHNIWINKDLEEVTPESIKEKYESNTNTNAFTDLDKSKVDKLIINGDGTKYLSDDGTYKIVDNGSDERTYIINELGNLPYDITIGGRPYTTSWKVSVEQDNELPLIEMSNVILLLADIDEPGMYENTISFVLNYEYIGTKISFIQTQVPPFNGSDANIYEIGIVNSSSTRNTIYAIMTRIVGGQGIQIYPYTRRINSNDTSNNTEYPNQIPSSVSRISAVESGRNNYVDMSSTTTYFDKEIVVSEGGGSETGRLKLARNMFELYAEKIYANPNLKYKYSFKSKDDGSIEIQVEDTDELSGKGLETYSFDFTSQDNPNQVARKKDIENAIQQAIEDVLLGEV